MGRSKKKGPESLLESMNQEIDEDRTASLDLEGREEPADDVELDDGENDPDKTVELDLSAEKPKRTRTPKAKASKRRTPRAKKVEPALTVEPLLVEHQEDSTAVRKEPVPSEAPAAPQPSPAPSVMPVHEAEHIREDVTIASASLQKTMESMVKQWGSVKEISGSICQELERVNTMLKTPPPAPEPVDMKEYLRQAAPRITLANKIALAVSTAACLVSALSFSLAASTRNKVLDNPLFLRQGAPVTAKTSAPAAKPQVILTPPATAPVEKAAEKAPLAEPPKTAQTMPPAAPAAEVKKPVTAKPAKRVATRSRKAPRKTKEIAVKGRKRSSRRAR